MTGTVVVTRFREPLDWVYAVQLEVCVYNKGEPLQQAPHVRDIACRNVGREAYGYLRYIIDHYDRLPDYVVFTQGEFRDHIPNGPFGSLLRGASLPPTERDMDIPWAHTAMQRFGWTETCNYTRGQRMQPAGKPIGEWFRSYIGDELPCPCPWWKNAIFCVRREQITRHPVSKYAAILETLDYENPETAHYMERFWYVLFNGSTSSE